MKLPYVAVQEGEMSELDVYRITEYLVSIWGHHRKRNLKYVKEFVEGQAGIFGGGNPME